MAYYSLTINTGALNDPLHRQGLAHLLEHMIPLSSEKYPVEDAYSDHLTSHNGYSKASTSFELTSFSAQVCYSGLEKALDMLSSFIALPLLPAAALNEEIEAIDEEY